MLYHLLHVTLRKPKAELMKVGFNGLGIMGSRMAANLQRAGHELVVYNRTQSKADELVAEGAVRAESPEAVAKQCRLVITMLSTPEAVEEVAVGPDGFLRALTGNSLWVDCCTVNPSFTTKMALHAKKMGQRFLDAPVSGSLVPAEKGELIFLVGGDASDLEQVQGLLGCNRESDRTRWRKRTRSQYENGDQHAAGTGDGCLR
jgi:3-hydroxyisobutyrate dehydrogenase/glyoxylate/succinic semialdehyde reductase